MVDKKTSGTSGAGRQGELNLDSLDAEQLRAAAVAEYVLGTLDSHAREACETLFNTDNQWADELAAWEDTLGDLGATVPPKAPPANAFVAIQRRLGWLEETQSRHWFSNFWPAVGGFVTALVLSVVLLPQFIDGGAETVVQTDTAAPGYVAVLVDAESGANWIVRYSESGQSLAINGSDKFALRPDRDLQLWAIYDGAPHPISLVPRGEGSALSVSSDVPADAKIAISLEPRGGSETGLPTGPVLAVSGLISL